MPTSTLGLESDNGPPDIQTVGLIKRPPRRAGHQAALLVSGVLNAFLIITVLANFRERGPSALHDASRERCSGHGMLYADADACACFDCWSGEDCSERLEGAACIVDANSGTPFIFEDYWVRHPEATVEILPSYHIGYGSHMPRLEAAIRALHELVGNAETAGREVVVGIGSTELISAAMYALAPDDAPMGASGEAPRAGIWSAPPYYSGYVAPASSYRTTAFEWLGPRPSDPRPPNSTAAWPVIELVTSPNNPDGHLRAPRVRGEGVRVVMDHAYLWPHFTPIVEKVTYGNDTVALFTLSKLTGHASTRLGWALTSSPDVAARLRGFVNSVSFGVPRENQLRAIAALEHLVSHHADILTYARARMLSRWHRLEAILASSRFEVEVRDAPETDSFSGEPGYESSPAYAWVRLADESPPYDGDAAAAMASVGIAGRPGDLFGASKRYVRLELLMREQTFDIMCDKLEQLVVAGRL